MKRYAIPLILVIFLAGCRGITFRVPGNSMSPTINEGDSIFCDPTYYNHSPMERGHIVLIEDPDGKVNPDGQKEMYVKRVVGLGGDKIQVIAGRLYVNDQVLGGAFGSGRYESDFPVEDFGPVVVPHENYFLVGDNLANSYDSRHWRRSMLNRGDIYGRVTQVQDRNTREIRSL